MKVSQVPLGVLFALLDLAQEEEGQVLPIT